MERQTRQSADIPKWSALLVEAVNKPGLIMKAYSAFHQYSIGNQLLALVQCQMRGLQPGPINTFPKWRELGRHVKRGERALMLCMPITCKRPNETTDEEAKLFEKLQGQEWVQRIVTMAINTGMRQGEIFDLTWFDVDLPRGVIHIRVAKNGKDRFVPINQTVRGMLEGLPHTSEYVFPSPKTEGRLIDVKSRFDLAKSDAGIKDFRFHDLRHTAATRMADCGADAFTLAAIFGWSDVRMALRYTHATDEAKRRAVENLVRPNGPSDESVTNEKGRVAALP